MPKIKNVFFDLGNTILLNSHKHTLVSAVETMAESLAKADPRIDRDTYALMYYQNLTQYYNQRDIDQIETDAHILMKYTLREMNIEDVSNDVLSAGLDAFYEVTEDNWRPDEGYLETIDAIRKAGIQVGLISNAQSKNDVIELLKRYNLLDKFSIIVVSATVGHRKPNQLIFKEALNNLHADPSESVMVGDLLSTDIRGAHEIGMKTIWLNRQSETGLQIITDHQTPDAIASSFSDILPIIFEMNQKETPTNLFPNLI